MTSSHRWFRIGMLVLVACSGWSSAHAQSCRKSDGCRQFGYCSQVEGKCLPASNRDCKRGKECKREGFCEFDKEAHDCVVGNTSCRKARVCREEGRCIAGKGECVVGTKEDCQRSRGCKKEGRCFFRDGGCLTEQMVVLRHMLIGNEDVEVDVLRSGMGTTGMVDTSTAQRIRASVIENAKAEFGKGTAQGLGCSLPRIQKTLGARKDLWSLKGCYQEVLKRDDRLNGGNVNSVVQDAVVVAWENDVDGGIANVSVKRVSTVQDEAFQTCVEEAFSRLSFSEPWFRGCSLKWTVLFSAKGHE